MLLTVGIVAGVGAIIASGIMIAGGVRRSHDAVGRGFERLPLAVIGLGVMVASASIAGLVI
jgi:hypothetical protein